MQTYPLAVMSFSRRLMSVVGLCLIGLILLFPAKSVEMHGRSATPDETLALGRLAYTVTRHLLGGVFTTIYTANGDGSGQALVDGIYALDPAWSPDATKIIYCDSLSIGADIYVVNPDGTNRINLTNTPMFGEGSPSWSVTGKIAFERGGQIWTMNSDGSNQAVFSAITQPLPVSPAWSPDGSKLAFASRSNIWVINADGTNERRLAATHTPDNSPAWSPDGLKIAFSKRMELSPTSFSTGITVINADGTNEVRLTSPSGNRTDRNPSWSNDGTKIAFDRNGFIDAENGIYVRDLNGGYEIRIFATFPSLQYNDPAWPPFPIVSRTPFDFDGDLRSDFAVYRVGATPTAQSFWYALRSSDSTFLNAQFGSGEDKIVPADYDGDGKTNFAVFRPSTGMKTTLQREDRSAWFQLLMR